jgi:hypothetical protein
MFIKKIENVSEKNSTLNQRVPRMSSYQGYQITLGFSFPKLQLIPDISNIINDFLITDIVIQSVIDDSQSCCEIVDWTIVYNKETYNSASSLKQLRKLLDIVRKKTVVKIYDTESEYFHDVVIVFDDDNSLTLTVSNDHNGYYAHPYFIKTYDYTPGKLDPKVIEEIL